VCHGTTAQHSMTRITLAGAFKQHSTPLLPNIPAPCQLVRGRCSRQRRRQLDHISSIPVGMGGLRQLAGGYVRGSRLERLHPGGVPMSPTTRAASNQRQSQRRTHPCCCKGCWVRRLLQPMLGVRNPEASPLLDWTRSLSPAEGYEHRALQRAAAPHLRAQVGDVNERGRALEQHHTVLCGGCMLSDA
jgi:hypothetical protein